MFLKPHLYELNLVEHAHLIQSEMCPTTQEDIDKEWAMLDACAPAWWAVSTPSADDLPSPKEILIDINTNPLTLRVDSATQTDQCDTGKVKVTDTTCARTQPYTKQPVPTASASASPASTPGSASIADPVRDENVEQFRKLAYSQVFGRKKCEAFRRVFIHYVKRVCRSKTTPTALSKALNAAFDRADEKRMAYDGTARLWTRIKISQGMAGMLKVLYSHDKTIPREWILKLDAVGRKKPRPNVLVEYVAYLHAMNSKTFRQANNGYLSFAQWQLKYV